jgi:hypothetical protein
MRVALDADVPIVLVYHNIGDRVDDENRAIHWNQRVCAISSGPIKLPEVYRERSMEEKTELLYQTIYDEYARMEARVARHVMKVKP